MRNADRCKHSDQRTAAALKSRRIARNVLRSTSEAEHRKNLDRYRTILEIIDRPKTADELAEAERMTSTPPTSRQGELF